MDTNLISSLIDEKVFGVWFLIGAALVFWMQAGFAMVECGFARAKNAGNIIMKNLMDFCIGTVVFIAIGFGLFLGEDMLMGFMGKPNIDILTNYATFDWSNFVFNLVFCANSYYRFRCYGRENKIPVLLRLFRSYLSCHLSYRSSLEMGRRLARNNGIPRFRRI